MLDKTFNPDAVESTWYQKWEKAGVFAANPSSNKAPFAVMMPPPNVTGAVDLPDNQIGAEDATDMSNYGQTSVLAKPAKANKAITVPDKPFLLDPLM